MNTLHMPAWRALANLPIGVGWSEHSLLYNDISIKILYAGLLNYANSNAYFSKKGTTVHRTQIIE